MKNQLLLFLLGLLGFSACTSTEEYGSPHADYRVSGKVTTPDGTPIPGIEVSRWEERKETVTSNQGNYLIDENEFWYLESLTFTDPDGPANGGEFEEKTVPVEFTDADRIRRGDGSWYTGAYAKTVDVILERKESQETEE